MAATAVFTCAAGTWGRARTWHGRGARVPAAGLEAARGHDPYYRPVVRFRTGDLRITPQDEIFEFLIALAASIFV